MSRRLVAVLACRANGTRLYGKPVQILNNNVTILDQIVATIRKFPIIEDIVLAISEEPENRMFIDIAHELGCQYILGDARDVLSRLVAGGRHAAASDVFRVTTECPFLEFSMLEEAWRQHQEQDSDVTVLDHVPEGVGFEIYRQEMLERSHREGGRDDRSEFCSNFGRFNQALFNVNIMRPEPERSRLDLRLTVDYPEDLILCRAVYREFEDLAPLIPLDRIVAFLDSRPDLRALVEAYVDPVPVWDGQPQRSDS